MAQEIGPRDALNPNRELRDERRYSKALRQMMTIYGADFMRAFDALEKSRQCLDLGSVAQAATHARRAAVMLRDSSIVNDRGRDPLDIVAEVCSIFPHKARRNFQDTYVYDEDCINEVQARLRCDREEAIGYIKVHHRGSHDAAPQLEEGPPVFEGDAVEEEVTPELES